LSAGRFRGPFVLEDLPVAIHQRTEVYPGADERPAAEMVDERIARDHGAETGLQRSPAVIVVLVTADAESLIQDANRIEHLAPDEKTESG